MASSTRGPDVIRVTQKGQATIPKELREKYGIDAPGEVFVYEEDGRIVLEPVPSLEELQGSRSTADDESPVERLRAHREEERRREAERASDLLPEEDE